MHPHVAPTGAMQASMGVCITTPDLFAISYFSIQPNICFLLDGNTKNSIRVTSNLKYNFESQENEEDSDTIDLQDFNNKLVVMLMKGAFFIHDEKEDIDMLKLPNIIAPRLTGRQVNSDYRKKSIFRGPPKSAELEAYPQEVFLEVEKLINKGQLNITELEAMDISVSKKS